MQRADLDSEREVLIEYLRAKTVAQDWHAVADAAMDLREIDAKLSVMSPGMTATQDLGSVSIPIRLALGETVTLTGSGILR